MHDVLFARPAPSAGDVVSQVAGELQLNRADFDRCLSVDGPARVQRDITEGKSLNIRKTPTLFIGRRLRDGRVKTSEWFVGVPKWERLKAALDKVIAMPS
jgi:hypothetical protein